MNVKDPTLKNTVKLSDDELDAVAGGEDWEMAPCPKCGKWLGGYVHECPQCHTHFSCLKCGAFFGYIGDVSECPYCHSKFR